MSKKHLAPLALFLFIIACKPEPTSTATTATSTTTPTATTVTVPEPPPEYDYKLDHFKFWKVKRSPYAETVELFGQADRDPWKAGIGPAEYIGNPVDKKREDENKQTPIRYKLHYLAYRIVIKESQPPRKVVLSNQFTREPETWIIQSPEWLLTPAGKAYEGTPEPQKGDHFACYAVHAPKAFPVKVTLQDQFDTRVDKVERPPELTPAYFCIPVQKRRKEKPQEGLVNPETHLAIYKFKPDPLKDPITVNTNDQFRRHTLTVIQSEWLAVPSRKHGKPEETKLPQ